MSRYNQTTKIWLLVLTLMSLLSNCSSTSQIVYKTPPQKYERLGRVTGSATGSLGLLATAYYVIPMGLNSRVERAYERALLQAPGATSLINVTYDESWYWWLLGTARTVTISGEAIREIK